MSATELDVCMDLLDVVIDTSNARAELAALRAEVKRENDAHLEYKRQYEHQAEVRTKDLQRIAVLEQAVDEAREAMDDLKHHGGGTKLTRAWLAAQPAAPKQVTP